MIDLGKVERRCKEVIANGYGKHPVIECASAECVMELITSLRKAEKDAARYRWLRDTGCFEGSADDLFHATPAETDAEFDRFMQCER